MEGLIHAVLIETGKMRAMKTVKSSVRRSLCQRKKIAIVEAEASFRDSSKRPEYGYKYRKKEDLPLRRRSTARKFLHISLDFTLNRISIEVSPPIQFRIEWADSQGM